MTRDDILRMAREARLVPKWLELCPKDEEALVRFAALVAAAERERVAAWMIQRSYATGHGDTTEDLLKELDWQIDERIAAEREECAQIADAEASIEGIAQRISAAIRARGNT